MRSEYIEAVLELAALIPPGKVLAYGDLAELLGDGGPRQVGSVMSHQGGAVAWWRVLRSSGQPLQGHDQTALTQYRLEETPLRGRTTGQDASWRVDMPRARWQPTEAEWQLIDAIAGKLEPRFRMVSEPDEITAP
ncbi:MGMT family protein [Psychromicrobium sp. YIM B11713]|uniref:MGMT family protein n=1 Tax=Psychromicrobium sp. YIM B11713 TaxID=3145233 RepID=UPI00374FC3A8